jgi:hypothetical protein
MPIQLEIFPVLKIINKEHRHAKVARPLAIGTYQAA